MATPATESMSYESALGEGSAPEPHLFVVLQCDRLSAPSLRIRLKDLHAVQIGRADRRTHRLDTGPHGQILTLGLPDERISTAHCLLEREGRGFVLRDLASKNGTRVNGQPLTEATLEEGALIEIGRSFLIYRRACPTQPSAPTLFEAGGEIGMPGLTTLLPQLAAHFAQFEIVAASTLPVLVRGESGTGKELVASALHRLSGRSGSFVPINCGAIPEALIASELFGYRKGAFSGAIDDRLGLVRAADHGTLFLDEIGDLHRDSQAALLRVLQEGEVLPLGATKALKVDVRLVAATHRDLEARAASGEFRGDLLARLGGFTLRLPPLRTRREDLGVVLSGILRRRLPERADRLTLRNSAARSLFASAFSLNIRELERAVLAAATLAEDDVLELAAALSEPDAEARTALDAADEMDLKARLLGLLRKHHGNVSAVAEEMGKARMQIQRWLKRYAIDPADFRSSDPREP